MITLRKWRRIYRTLRVMVMLDLQQAVDVRGWDLRDGRSEVHLDVCGFGKTSKVKPYIEKITGTMQGHPGVTQ